MSWGGDVRHVAVLISHEPREFGPDAIALAETLANQAAAAFALLESEATRTAHAERDGALGASLDLVEVLDTLGREVDLALGAAMAGSTWRTARAAVSPPPATTAPRAGRGSSSAAARASLDGC